MNSVRDRESRAKRHSIELFKYFVQFLEIFGQENYGGSAEVNWPAVYSFCESYGLFDFNDDLEEIVYSESEEEFRDKAFEYIEKQILDGYPVWRLFNMSKWLFDKFEKELDDQEREKDIKYFNKVKCYKCKHFSDHMEYFTKQMTPKRIFPGEVPEGISDIRAINIHHTMSCSVRNDLLAQNEKEFRFEGRYKKFKYKKFNSTERIGWEADQRRWTLIPWELKNCPYFENNDMTPEEFLKLYFEISRLYKDKD